MKNKSKSLIPANAKKLNDNFLAEGEVTGHFHKVHGVVGVDFQLYEKDGVKFCELLKDTRITHEEHKSQELKIVDFPQGFEVHIVREYDHLAEEARQVAD